MGIMGDRSDGQTPLKTTISGWFRSLNLKDKATVLASLGIVFIVITTSILVLTDDNQERFTEFYVLNSDGQAFNYPQNVDVGNTTSIIVGVANHEGRTVNYTVEAWLVNYTLIDMAVNVTQMYYLDSFNIVLESVSYEMDAKWVPQYEKEISMNLTNAGNFYLYILLFYDDAPVYSWEGTPLDPILTPLDHDYNFNTDPYITWRVILCVNQDITYLQLVMTVV